MINSTYGAHRSVQAPIAVGVDGSDAGYLAVHWAAETAAQRGQELRILHGLDLDATRAVVGSYDLLIPSVVENLRRRGAHTVQSARAVALDVDPALRVATEVSSDNPSRLLLGAAATACMMVLGASGNRLAGAHFGSTLLAVTRHAPGVVVVVRGACDESRIRRGGPVVVGVDGSLSSADVLAAAFEEASMRHVELIAVHTWSDVHIGHFAGLAPAAAPNPESDESPCAILGERLVGWQEKYPGVVVTTRLYFDGPADRLAELSRAAQLVVVGSRGRGGFTSLLLGSTSSFLVQHAHCPVMVVHPGSP